MFVVEGRLNFVRQPIELSFALYTFYNYILERTFHVDYYTYTITIYTICLNLAFTENCILNSFMLLIIFAKYDFK